MESCKSDIIINNSNLSTQKSNNYKPERTFELESKFLKMKNQRIKRSFTIGSGIGHRWVPNELQNQSSFFLSAFLALWERANGVIIIIIVIIGVGFGLWMGTRGWRGFGFGKKWKAAKYDLIWGAKTDFWCTRANYGFAGNSRLLDASVTFEGARFQ